jgi:hypothetical protein
MRRIRNKCNMRRKSVGKSNLAEFPFPPKLPFGYGESRYSTNYFSSTKRE